jgi:hypothetical protein
MPTYTFFNELTGIEWDEMMSNSDREKYLEKHPNITQIPGGFAFVGDHIMGMGPKQDGGMTENLQRIAEAHPGSALADRYTNESTKSIKTREVLKKHKVI